MRINPNELTEVSQIHETLDELIPSYGTNNAQLSELKKVTDAQNKRIKELMAEDNLELYETGDYKATYNVSQRESYDEEKLLTTLKEMWAKRWGAQECPMIKTKEYVDIEALEDAIYVGKLTTEEIAQLKPCINQKEVVTLRVTKRKKK